MRKFCLIAQFIGFLSFTASPALADIAGGLAAYDGGDYAEALAEWRPLARAGDPEAQTALAGMYAQGLGVAENPSMAAEWYRRAACQGAGIVQLNLGDMYARGIGVRRDRETTVAWLQLAAQNGLAWAARRRDEITRASANEHEEEKSALRTSVFRPHYSWRP